MLNKRFKNGETLSDVAINGFADLSDEQIAAFTNGNRDEPIEFDDIIVRAKDVVELTPDMVQPGPPSKDWRAENHVTAVKDQGYNCNSCWAFSVRVSA